MKIVNAIILLFFVVTLNFLLIRLAPGDPAQVIAGDVGGASPEMLAKIRSDYGFDQPLLVQLGNYLVQIASGDLGFSYYFNRPVAALIGERLSATLLLSVAAMVLAIVGGIVLGLSAGKRPKGVYSNAVTVISVIGFAMPVFWLGTLLIMLFSIQLGWFPTSGMTSVLPPESWFGRSLDVLRHLVLPSVSLALIYLAVYSRTVRANAIEVFKSEYVRTARAKGMNDSRLLRKHVMRSSLIPLITVAGIQTGALLSGAVLVEVVFAWPGIGRLALDSILRRDTPVVIGILLCSSLLVILANLITDLVYRLVDPRIRVGAN